MIQVLLITLLSCSSINWLNYKDDNNKFSISYPETWDKNINNGMVVFFTKKENQEDLFRDNINIIVQNLSNQPLTLEEYTNLTKQQVINEVGASAIQSTNDVILAGQKAKEMIYIIPKNPLRNQLDLKIRQVWFIQNNKAYLLTYTAEKDKYEKYLQEVLKIDASFKLLN
jgi:serine/threonine-protein kinase